MVTRTGAYAYHKFDFESTFNGDDATKTKVLGKNVRLSPIQTMNNQIPLPQLNSVEIEDFAYGQEAKRLSADWVLSNPWWLELVTGSLSTTGSSPYTHTYTAAKAVKSFAMEIGFQGTTANVVRTLLGCIMPSVTIRSSLNDVVRCSADIVSGKESTIGTSLDSSPPSDDIDFPYTFAHGSLQFPDGNTIAELQSFDLTINQNAQLVYGHGSKSSAGAFRGVSEYTARFNAAMIDSTELQKVLDRAEIADAVITFTNGLAGANEKSITITVTGVSPSEHSMSLAGVDPVFEDLVWQGRSISIAAVNNVSTPP